jgi:signal transduction histidine kinase/MFS family permease
MAVIGAQGLEQFKRLEHGLVRVRWFAVLLGIYLNTQTNAGPPPHASDFVVIGSQALMAALALGNVAVSLVTNRVATLRGIRKVGLAAFTLDAVVILSVAWLFSYDPRNPSWVVIFILPLEGAIRYRLAGALASVAILLVSELGREAYLASRFAEPEVHGGALLAPYPFLVSNVAFRVGIAAIVAFVAGFMSRSLAREAERAARQATRFEEVARREAAARRELAAFNTAILAGVAAEDLDVSLQLMAGAIGRDLEFETMTILLRDGDDLLVRGMYGMPFYEQRIPIGQGVTGTVAKTGTPLVVSDVGRFPGYIMADPGIRSEMAAPMRVGDDVIGVLDVESRKPEAFDEAALASLSRLADQIALVAHSNRLLSQQRATVERLQELDQMKSDFVAITSHELRTPLTAIRGYTRTLIKNRQRLSKQQMVDFIDIIDRQAARLGQMVEDLLLVTRIEAGALRLETTDIDLETFVLQSVESFVPERRSRIRPEVSSNGRAVRIDPDRVDQVVRNLLDNALKFSPPEAPVLLRAAVTDGVLELSVTDRGSGIPPEELPHIFERFHQAGTALTREVEGVGLGLYITRGLVEAMGGSIEVSSQPGAGSTFVVRLPQARAQDDGNGREPQTDPRVPVEPGQTRSGVPQRPR